jgi:crotonobetainyl-CoA:carnitine CoA-transferase CaiB-like acyl-CoA transferase
MSERPLAGFRVVDLADEKGEMCGRMLADLGADVLRVEPPGGARSRRLPPFAGDTSLFFAYRNLGKRGAVLDLTREADRERLHALLAGADALIESAMPGALAAISLDPAALVARHPHLVVTSISDFGQSGPYRDWVATDAVLEAVGGMMFKAGLPDREPLIPPGAVASDVAGILGAFATLCAFYQRRGTGRGQHIDVSAVVALAQITDWSLPNAAISRVRGAPYGEKRQGSGPIYKIYACKGGYVRLVILSPRQWRAMWEWLGRPEAFADPYWEAFLARLQNADVLNALYTEHFASLTMDEVCSEAQRRGIVCTPVLRPEEVLANVHFASRRTFAEAEVAPGVRGPVAQGFHELDGGRLGFRGRAPAPGENQADLAAAPAARPAPRGPAPAPAAPLAGLRVLDFGIGGVGVEAGRMLAEYGADVIKIESRTYPDFIRTVLGSEMSPSFASSSRSKRSFGVDVKRPEGLAVLHRLVALADVVIENNSTGTMDDMGVGWSVISRLNPRCVMVSSQLLGSHGAWKDWIGYGPSTQPMGGMVHLWNYADRDAPAGSLSIFPDHLAGRLVAVNALAALLRRERTGRGGHGEVAQVEVVTAMLGDWLCKAGIEPGSVAPRGNRSERGAPWGAYPCAGDDQWCVITVRDDDDWRRLREALGDPAWSRDPACDTAKGRLARQDALDAALSEWTRARGKADVAATLQRHGVPCGPMLTSTDQLDDPHFNARGYMRWVEQQDLGRIAFEGPCFQGSAMRDADIRQAPRLGEHTREICRDLLGMQEAEIQRLIAAGALEEPRPAPASA